MKEVIYSGRWLENQTMMHYYDEAWDQISYLPVMIHNIRLVRVFIYLMLGLQMPVTTLPGSGRRRAFIQREHKEKLRETVVPSRIVMVQWLKTKKGSLVHWFCHGQQLTGCCGH